MKTIKTILSLLVISAMTIIGSGCVQNQTDQKVIIKFENLTVLETTFNPDAGKHAYEYDFWSYENRKIYEEKIKSTSSKEFTVKFNGKKYTGTFNDVNRIVPGPFTCYYRGENFSFEINAKTKELVSFTYHVSAFDHGQTLDEAKCREIADNFASKYIEINQCSVEATISTGSNQYMFVYSRNISDIETGEVFYVYVDGNGNITDFYSRVMHGFDNVLGIEFDEKQILDAIEAKLATIYEGVDNYESYTVKNFYIVQLEDGRFALVYNVNAQFEKKYFDNGSYTVPLTPIRLLITGATLKPAN